MIKSYKELEVWKLGYELAKKVYIWTEKLPPKEMYGLTSQIRRASISIPSNIAEGQQRHHRKEFIQFLYLALGSIAELETQLNLASEIYNIEIKAEERETMEKLGKKMRALIISLQQRETSSSNHKRSPLWLRS